MVGPLRSYFVDRRLQHSLLDYDFLELDSRAFDGSSQLTFRYEYCRGKTLSTEVFRCADDGSDCSYGLFNAIAEFHQFLEGRDSAALDRFVTKARLLLNRTITIDGFRAIPRFTHVKGYGDHKIPWISCHSQGWAMSVFCRAYSITREDQFLEGAHGIMRSFAVEVARGGVLDHEKTGHIFFEEYPFPGKTRHVLNGFITSLFGIHEFGRATGDPLARSTFDEGIETLSDEILDTFDAGYTSRYDQMTGRPGPASFFYTKVHARQLAILHRRTGKPHFLRRAQLWKQYATEWTNRALLFLNCLAYRAANTSRYARDLFNGWVAGLPSLHPQQPRHSLTR